MKLSSSGLLKDLVSANQFQVLPLLSFTFIKIFSQDWGNFFKNIHSIIDIDKLPKDFIFLCREESNLKVGAFVHTVLPDCDTDPPHV